MRGQRAPPDPPGFWRSRRLVGVAAAGLGGLGNTGHAEGRCGPVVVGALRRTKNPGVGEPLKNPSLEATKEKCGRTPFFLPTFPNLEGCEEQLEHCLLFLIVTGFPQNHRIAKQGLHCRIMWGWVLLSRFLQSACTMYFACSPVFIIEGDFCPSHGSS